MLNESNPNTELLIIVASKTYNLSFTSHTTLDIVVPCFNPQKDWVDVLITRFQSVSQALTPVETRCILVNDGSTQNVTAVEIEKLKSAIPTLIYVEYAINQGKGHAVRLGMQRVESDFSAFTDIDFPYETSCFIEMYQALKQGKDIVIGHRSSNYYNEIPPMRKWMSQGLRSLMKYFLRIPVTDTQSGLKFFNLNGKQAILATSINRYLFDLELIKIASKKDFSIHSVELKLRQGIQLENMSLRIMITEFKNLMSILFSK